MVESHHESLITGAISTGIVAVLTLRVLLSLGSRLGLTGKRYEPLPDEIYRDQDGQASEETQEQFSSWIPRSITLLAACLGLLSQITNGVYLVTQVDMPFVDLVEVWLRVGAWALITLQSVNLFVEKGDVARFDCGVRIAVSCVPVASVIALVNLVWRHYDSWNGDPIATIEGVQAAMVFITFVASLMIPRRPVVFFNEKPVDNRYTTSFLGRVSFAWPFERLSFAKKNRKMTLDDIPSLSNDLRSKVLLEGFHNSYQFKRLWARMLWYFRSSLAEAFVMISLSAVLQFIPQLAMYQILKLIEQKTPGMPVAGQAYLYVLGFGFSMIVNAFLETWLFWIVEAHLGIPARSTLSSLIFEKATRKKNVQGKQKKKTPAAAAEGEENSQVLLNEDSNNSKNTNGAASLSPGQSTKDTVVVTGDEKKESSGASDDGDEEKKTRQAVINLIAVDTQRFQFFMTYSYFYPNFIVKITVSMLFLLQIIGWAPLVAGLLALACNVPFNIYFSKKYTGQVNRLMKYRDQKLAIVTEALQGIRQIKYSAIEKQWYKRISDKRAEELDAQWTAYLYDIGLAACWVAGPVLLSGASLTVYALIHHDLSASVAFTTIAVLQQIEVALAVLPELITNAVDAFISINRIDKFLGAAEVEEVRQENREIIFKDASITWPVENTEEEDEDRFVLKNIKVHFPRHELSVISGKTGSGKTLLLNALLGEVELIQGTIDMPCAPPLTERYDDQANASNWIVEDAVSYVPQIPWIENATIKDNILFGLPYDEKRYKNTIKVCALEPDIAILQDGELTEVGSTGIGLSGGQKWRVSFARALYSRAGILVLDDIFSAVDAHVGRQLYEEALTGELGSGRTRILVTHHISLVLPKTKYIAMLADGTVEHAGNVSELNAAGVLNQILEEEKEEAGPSIEIDAEDIADDDPLKKVMSRASERKIDSGAVDTKGTNVPKKFVETETRQTGAVKIRMYKTYLRESGGWLYWIPIIITYLAGLLLSLTRPYWVSLWTRSYQEHRPSLAVMSPDTQLIMLPPTTNASFKIQDDAENATYFYLSVYLALSAATIVIGTLRYLTLFLASLRASKRLFDALSLNVLHAPLRWLDTTPTGRILNRFTADFNTIDSNIAPQTAFFMYQFLELLGITVIGCVFVSVYVIPLAVVLFAVVIWLGVFYLAGAREVKRLESNAKSPVFEQFGSFLIGITSVRAYSKAPEYISRMYNKIDTHLSAYYLQWVFNRWMGFRQSIVGAIFATVVAIILISNDFLDASLAGFTLSFIISYTRSIIWVIRCYAMMEMNMNAVERVVDYTELETEEKGGHSVPAGWPTQGRLEIADLEVAYAPDLPSVLKGLTFTVEKGQRIGIVGRTGSGKSTLTLALFRFLSEFRAGTIHIDGIDISKIKLHDLRSRLAIIPQDPVLFSGTVRSNLDDFNEYSDAELRSALERVHLISSSSTANTSGTLTPTAAGPSTSTDIATDKNTNIFKSLSSQISEGGLNISQGQRQLLCLARAIARKPKVMVLDEATSAVDMATDELIQKSIRSEFANCTLLVIAHRLSTIADFDRILVMGDGVAKEFGTPKELLDIEDGIFKSMVESSGEKERLEAIIRGNDTES